MVKRPAMFAAIAAVSGCTALLGIDKDYTLADGGIEAGIDVKANDVQVEVGTDAAADGPALRRCQVLQASDAAPVFCDDFDDGTPFGSKWSQLVNQPPWFVGLAFDASVSPPASLFGIADIDASVQAGLHEAFVSPASTLVAVEGDVRLDQFSGPTSYAFTPLEIGLELSAMPQWRARLDVYPDHCELEEFEWQTDGGFGFDFNALSQHLSAGTWTHIRIEVLLPTHTTNVYFDGTVVLAHISKFQWMPGHAPMASAGMLESRWGFVGPWKFHVDNVAVYAN
jgi:hypothetical protein